MAKHRPGSETNIVDRCPCPQFFPFQMAEIYGFVGMILTTFKSWELTYPQPRCILKMIHLFPRWDMLVPWRVLNGMILRVPS